MGPAMAANLAIPLSEARTGRLKGARYKIPHMIIEEVLSKPRLVAELRELSAQSGRPVDALEREARSYLREMAASHTIFGMELAAAPGRSMYTRGFDEEIDVPVEDLERIRALLSEKPAAFAFTHRRPQELEGCGRTRSHERDAAGRVGTTAAAAGTLGNRLEDEVSGVGSRLEAVFSAVISIIDSLVPARV
jgi:hypothetical protein